MYFHHMYSLLGHRCRKVFVGRLVVVVCPVFLFGLFKSEERDHSSSSQPAVAVSTLPLPVKLLLVLWPPVVLGSHAATLALSDRLNSTLVGSTNQVESEDSGAQVDRKCQEREWSTRLDDDSLKTVA
jgi:hypothetical protein